ncbi:hypothetical protein [Paenibacillus xylanexedens]|uniref:hypothetical protein n=1 Tax=Paenibacillus xylanexedens TaxID=528191 RepID=UPI001C92F23B|nr:hypothetical protein [Paenibacillus xylanexedens]
MTEQLSIAVIARFFDSLCPQIKSGDKGEAYSSDVAFLQKAFSSASPVFSVLSVFV